ncbi:cyclin-dependent kinases regulatory subunit, putative [Plasmodium chabaudi chabaudi]|uniref:Cyclin-dependent kinases regulatory subunit n=1 Tax=Plasmodium chabaudi chabaudi TaxID=31271 RepID=A0A4V0K1X9_PLACU|nr:cyclin-dependent kinases regulatory subunit, putative [Plasmodium chabaudi chabaudi]VTZ66837.1 cyclin-dependent kinases regulatory subunit, putative [Plasmodium chabaudi chabaudi]|eukprot:XP_737919.2 conserved Plasmodium protein, unknown function [Plasmodium chabaudi chabaudi]
MPSDNNCFYNINLSIHKIFNPRYSAPNKISDESRPANKKRRCTVSYINERTVSQKFNNDYLNYNFNNSITKRRKCSPNLAYPNKKYSPLMSRRELRNSVNQSIKKSEALRSIVSETIQKKKTETCGNKDNENFYNINKKKYYLSRYSEDNNSSGIENVKDVRDKKNIKLYLSGNRTQGNNQMGSGINLNESYIMSSLAQSENCYKNKNMDSLNTFRENLPIYVNSQSTFSSFNFDREIENKYVKKILQDNCQTVDNDQSKQNEKHNIIQNQCLIKNKYSYITDMNPIEKQELEDNNNNEQVKKNKYISINSNNNRSLIGSNHNDKPNRNTITNSLKRRHSIQFEKEHEKYNYSDSIYVNKRFKETDKNNKSSTRRHSDVIGSNSINGIYMNNMRNSVNFQNNMDPNMARQYNASNNSHNFKNIDVNKNAQEHNEEKPWFKNCFLKNDGIFDNHQGIRKQKIDTANSNGHDEPTLKNDAEYLFSTEFFKDVYSNIQRKGELNFIDELLEKDTEYYISKSKLNKIVENAKNKETKYHYIDRLFLYRHAKHVVGDKEYEAYKNKCRSKQKYLDVPFPNLSEIMNLHPISDLDEIDDSDEFYGAEVKLLEDFYSKPSKTKDNTKICTLFNKNKDIENKIVIKKRPPVSKPDDLYVLGTREKLISLMNKMKREKDSFFEQILDAPDFSKLLEPVHSVNESFLLSHQLFNLQHAAQFGPVVYLIKTEDEKYIYRAIEVSKLYEDKVKSILDNKKQNSDNKERNDGYDCYSNERYPFLHELDVKYYLKIPMSTGWNHFCYLKNQHNVLFFRRPKNPSSLQ